MSGKRLNIALMPKSIRDAVATGEAPEIFAAVIKDFLLDVDDN